MVQNDRAIEQETHSTQAEQWQENEPEIYLRNFEENYKTICMSSYI